MFKTIGDLEVNYVVEGEGHPLLLLHGGGADAVWWEEVIPSLARHFQVYAMDLRGHGKTVRPPEPKLHADVWTEDLKNFMDSFGIERAALAGWSLGGIVVMNFATVYPDRVTHLIPMGAPGSHTGVWDRKGFEDRMALVESGIAMKEIVEKTFEFTKVTFSKYSLEHNPTAVEKVRQMLSRNRPTDYAEMLRCREDPAILEGKLKAVTCPSLVICGDSDSRTPLEMSENLHKALPNSYLRIIADCGHNYAREQPEATSRSIITFVTAFR